MELQNAQAWTVDGAAVERKFMSSVYRWMTLGMVVTAAVAWFVASTPALVEAVFTNRPIFWGLVIAQFGVVMALTAGVNRLSAGVAGVLFLLYSALTGTTLSVILLAYSGASVATAFVITAGTFGAMSVYGSVTKSDLRGWGTFLFMGLIGVVLASVGQVVIDEPITGSEPMMLVITVAPQKLICPHGRT